MTAAKPRRKRPARIVYDESSILSIGDVPIIYKLIVNKSSPISNTTLLCTRSQMWLINKLLII